MKRGYLLFLIVSLPLLLLHAQTPGELTYTVNKEGKIIAIPKYKSYELNIPAYSYKSYTPSSERDIEMKLQQFVPEFQPTLDERPMDMQVMSDAYRPFFDIYAPMMINVSPMAFDFRETAIAPINENLSFYTTGTQYSWPGLGGITTINPGLLWNKDNWTVTGGGFAGRFFTPFNPSPEYMGGVNLQVKYDVNERISLLTWGQYAIYSRDEKYNPHMLMNPFYNHSNVGGAIEYMFNENFGIGGGVNYEYNPRRRKMEPQYLIFPVIRSGNVKIGIW